MMSSGRMQRYGLLLFFGFGALIAMPWVLGGYTLRLLTESIIFSLYAVSYNMLLGYAGLLSFGHAMFFGVGAFATTVALEHIAGLPLLLAVTMATAFTALVGLVVGILLLRVKGTPFALLTLAFNALFFSIGIKWTAVTGGDDGAIVNVPDINIGLIRLNLFDGPTVYFVTLAVVGSVIAFCWYFTRTAMGQSVLLIRENEERMRFLGYNTHVSRLILFVFSGSLAGLAGAFYAVLHGFVSLDAVSIAMTTKVLLMTFIGGIGHFVGPVLGAVFYTYFQNFISELTDSWPLIMGVLFIAMVLWTPGGLAGMIQSAAAWIAGRKASDGAPAEER
ncbi:branched-chain amino acid ABC transporter permease [Desulfosarcina widdelii]|uniref:Branched-chain amino acid ABC transporter permease n=1 Tax=Desulfosarcina widdelii TaxID=947919 RepID=A0A5K7ZB92_9BACT|nr:branched-chain amino acid ABC transporter permease [Desulfosarcina widdelii]BBO76981.1 branched-chain amino acid ABC transporter permease [Desulfosarcina widdelii]